MGAALVGSTDGVRREDHLDSRWVQTLYTVLIPLRSRSEVLIVAFLRRYIIIFRQSEAEVRGSNHLPVSLFLHHRSLVAELYIMTTAPQKRVLLG